MAGGETEAAGERLGDLLYGDRTATRVSENDWVALVRAVGAGDQRALHALYNQTHRLVFTLVVRLVNDRRTAEELTVDVFHEIWRRASKYDPVGGPVLGWLMNLARSRAIDRLRYEQRQKRSAPAAADDPLRAQSVNGGEEALAALQRRKALRESLVALTPGEREAIETAFFLDLTYPEVATRLNQPLGTVKTRIRSGLEKLRHALVAEVERP
jgi:RNA polymerase sigma-70 factor, ECF subfamily